VKACVAGKPMPFEAVSVSAWVPPVPGAGVPEMVAAPVPLSVKVTPDGRTPDDVMLVTAGVPAALMEKLSAVPTVNVVAAALENHGLAGRHRDEHAAA
jgi:hypothetical protein